MSDRVMKSGFYQTPTLGQLNRAAITRAYKDKQAKKNGKKEQNYDFLFGYEESYGYLAGTHARDKDAVVSSLASMFVPFADSNLFQRKNRKGSPNRHP